MPRLRLSVRKIREILRLYFDRRLSVRQIAKSCDVARSTVSDYLDRAQQRGLAWPLPEALDDAGLQRQLFPPEPKTPGCDRPRPDWNVVKREMRRKGVTLYLLWQEYKAVHNDGYKYSWFCEHYHRWSGKVDLVMRQEHRAGEKLFVDYAGQTVEVVDRQTGEIRQAQIFVAVLGASSYCYAEATWTQKLPDWIGSHVRTLNFLGGCPDILVPDNLKSGVTRPHLYEPDLNPTYQDLANHYDIAVIPARSRKPKDKAKVEVGVLVVERWILARLRNITFFSLAELNEAIATLLIDLNKRAFQKIPGSRRQLFEQLDKPALKPLPSVPYEYAEWKKARVHIDYHVAIDHHCYSVPYQLVGKKLDVRLSAHIVEVLHKGKRVASHRRCYDPKRRFTTLTEHMPKSHQAYAEWTPERLIRWAEKTGPLLAQVIESLMVQRRHPQQAFRSCLGLMRLGKTYGQDRLEAACRRALAIGACNYKSIDSILKHGLDRQALPETAKTTQPVLHPNIRGARYYQ